MKKFNLPASNSHLDVAKIGIESEIKISSRVKTALVVLGGLCAMQPLIAKTNNVIPVVASAAQATASTSTDLLVAANDRQAILLTNYKGLSRGEPANFRRGAADLEYRMWWNKKEFGSIVFFEVLRNSKIKDDELSQVLLMTTSKKSLTGLLVGMGFEEGSASAWTSQPSFNLNEKKCLVVTTAAQSCVDVWLSLADDQYGKIELIVAGAQENVPTDQMKNAQLALVGSTFFSAGKSMGNSGAGNTNYLDLTTRGIVSRSSTTFEYDGSVSGQTVPSEKSSNNTFQYAQSLGSAKNPSTNSVRYRLLAVGQRFGQGRAYGGLFTSASSDSLGAGGTAFLSHPSIMGFAYKSGDGVLNSFGVRRKVRLLLNADSFVRVLSNGSELYSGVVSAGDRIVEFSGYAEGFVDVLVRDASGKIEQRQVEVFADAPADGDILPAIETGRSNFYVDAGRVMDNSFQDNRDLKRAEISQASFVYNYLGDMLAYQGAAQIVGDRRRVAGGVSDRSYLWRLSAMKGNDGEYGINAGATPPLPQDFVAAVSATRYQPPSGGQVAGTALTGPGSIYGGVPIYIPTTYNTSCNSYGNALCFSNTSYTSWSAGFSRKDFPLRLGYLSVKTSLFDVRQVTLSGSTDFLVSQARWTVVGFLNYDLKRKTSSLFVSLVVPLEKQIVVSSGISTDFNGTRSLNTAVSQNFDESSSEYLRSASLSVSNQSNLLSSATSGTASVSSQLGPVANLSSGSWSSLGNRAISTSFAASYGVTSEGVAFARDGRAVLGGQTLGENNTAAVTILNRSEERQKISIDGTSYEVPAKSTQLVPRNPGYVKEVVVSPGPVMDAAGVKTGRYLEKGNVKAVLIADGFWAIESFQLLPSAGKSVVQLVPDYTYKRDGADIEKVFPDRKDRSLIYETRDGEEDVVRYITVRDKKEAYRCVAPAEQSQAVAGNTIAYRLLSFSCAAAPANIN